MSRSRMFSFAPAPPLRDLRGRAALVTGGGTGIGRGIALALARRGARVALCGRRLGPLAAVAAEIQACGGEAAVLPGDIADHAARAEIVAGVRAAFGPLHLLVNNAGVLAGGALCQLNGPEIDHALATNLAAPVDLTRLALADLAMTHGAVIFVGSTTSHVPLPYTALYSASKGGLHALCTALRYELTPLGIHLLAVYPPTVATAMTAPMAQRAGELAPHWLPQPLARAVRTALTRAGTPEDAGEQIVAALAAGRHDLLWGGTETWLPRLGRIAPGLTAALLSTPRRRFAHVMTPGPPAASDSPAGGRHGVRAPTAAELRAELHAVRAAYPLRTATVGGHPWSYLDTQRGGDVLLLLPGAMGEADTSFQYIAAFAPSRRVISLSYPAKLDRLTPLVEGLRQFLAAADVARADIVGGSYSGLIAQYFAARYPSAVRALLLANSAAPDPNQASRWRAAAAAIALTPQPLVHAAMRNAIRRFLPGDSPVEEFWRGYFAETIGTLSKGAVLARLRLTGTMHAAGGQLHRAPYRGPTFVLHAAGDALVPRKHQAALRTFYPHAEHVTLPARGHVASLDAADVYITLYQEFLCRNAR